MYRRPRLVALNLRTPVLEAARAIENNNIGAVVVVDGGSVAGIVTDRDLALRVLARGLDPKATLVGDVMSSPVAVLSLSDSHSDAIRLMRERNIRRIPLTEGDRLAGIVTLDDLLLDEAAPLDQMAAIVVAQIGEGGPTPPLRSPAVQRRTARAESTYRRLLNEVSEKTGLANVEDADIALEIVLTALVSRLTPGEAKDLISQLPSLLHPGLLALPTGPDKLISRESIEAELAQSLGVEPARAAEVLAAVGATIARNVSEGQMEDVRGQLPQGLREIFTAAAQEALFGSGVSPGYGAQGGG
jgi:uncharacterized protein (DUF2267 family)/predicted transcriptional regulator